MPPLTPRYFIAEDGTLEENPSGDLVKFRDHAESVQEERDFKIALYLDEIRRLKTLIAEPEEAGL